LVAGEAGARDTVGARALRLWTATLAPALARAGVRTNGPAVRARLERRGDEASRARLLDRLPAGVSGSTVIPAIRAHPTLEAEMPGYRHVEELAALVSPAVRRRDQMRSHPADRLRRSGGGGA